MQSWIDIRKVGEAMEMAVSALPSGPITGMPTARIPFSRSWSAIA
jgi:hypothetical protein